MFGRVMPPPIYTVLVPSETVSPPMAEGDEIKDATWATPGLSGGASIVPGSSWEEGGLSEKQVCRGQRLGCCGASADAGVSQAQTPPPMPRPREEPALPTPRGPRDLGPPQLRETFLVPKPLDL